MLKIYKDDLFYHFAIYEEGYATTKENEISYGISYDIETERFVLMNGRRNLSKDSAEVPLYELVFNEKNILQKMKKKIKRRIKFLNKKTSQILTQSDFLIIVLLQEIEKYEKELNL